MNSFGSVFRISGRQDAFRRALAAIAAGMNYYDAVDPPATDAPHRVRDRMILETLLLNRTLRREFATLETTHGEEVRVRGELLFELLQAAWSEDLNLLSHSPNPCAVRLRLHCRLRLCESKRESGR